MAYTITIQRKVGTNAYDSLIVLATKYKGIFTMHLGKIVRMFQDNGSYLSCEFRYDEDVTRAYIEYDLSKGE